MALSIGIIIFLVQRRTQRQNYGLVLLNVCVLFIITFIKLSCNTIDFLVCISMYFKINIYVNITIIKILKSFMIWKTFSCYLILQLYPFPPQPLAATNLFSITTVLLSSRKSSKWNDPLQTFEDWLLSHIFSYREALSHI